MDKLSKNIKRLIVVGVILFVAYTLCVFVIPFNKTPACWIAYIFSVIAMAFSGYLFIIAIEKKDTLKSKVYGLPILRIGYIYLIAQFVVSVLVYVISSFIYVPLWIALVLSVVLLAFALVGSIAAETVRETIEQVEEQVVVETKRMSEFRLDAFYLVDMCEDQDLKKLLSKLAEEFRYSDPVSSEETKEIEDNIKNEVKTLNDYVLNNELEKAIELVHKVNKLLIQRNRMCKEYKK